MVTERAQRMLDLVELDYSQTSEFVRGVLGTATTVRGWAITIWLALAGFSIQQDEWLLSTLGVVVAVGFYAIDAYHLNLYRQGLGHLQTLERLYAEYYGALARSEFHPDALREFLIDLETHRFGFYRRLGPFRLRQSIARGPRVFVALYAVLIAISAVLAVIEATTNIGG
jgi:hypothetical protein